MHSHPLIHILGFVGLLGAALPLFRPHSGRPRIWVAHLAMVAAMAAMFIPDGAGGWAGMGAGCILIALAMWITADTAERSSTFSCVTDLMAMALIMVFVSPTLLYADFRAAGSLSAHGHHASLYSAHQVATGPMSSFTWLGAAVLTCWAVIALYPLLTRTGPIGRQAKITASSSILMLVGMAPMAV